MGSKVSLGLIEEMNPIRKELISRKWHVEQVFTYLEGSRNLVFMDEGGYLLLRGMHHSSP